jgi:hypothetical protein
MKQFFGLVALCGLLLPSVALAQAAPPPMQQHPDMAGMKQVFEQVERIHRAERTQVLAALTPAHRELLARIVGEMAIAANPDHKAAAARLDSALSANEKNAVLAAHTTAMTQARNAMHEMMANMPRPQGSAGPRPRWHEHEHGNPTAGEVVLMVASGHGEHGEMPFGPPPPGMMRYHNGPGMQGPPGAPPAPAPANT